MYFKDFWRSPDGKRCRQDVRGDLFSVSLNIAILQKLCYTQ